MANKAIVSPCPQQNPITDKQFKILPVWSRWLAEIIDVMGRLINRYDSTKSGSATLVAGTKVVANINVLAGSLIRMTPQNVGGAAGHLSVTLNPGVGFTITSTSGTDTRTIFYEIAEAF